MIKKYIFIIIYTYFKYLLQKIIISIHFIVENYYMTNFDDSLHGNKLFKINKKRWSTSL